MKNFKAAAFAVLISVALTACIKPVENQLPAATASEANSFDFATKKLTDLSVNYHGDTHFLVYAENPLTSGDAQLLFRANTIGGSFTGTMNLPAGLTVAYFVTMDENGTLSQTVAAVPVTPGNAITVDMANYNARMMSSRSMRPPGPYDIEYSGYLAFEDNWPSKGDYDMNDVGVYYACKITFNEDNTISSIEDKFTPVRKGCWNRNGFGYQYSVAPSAVASVKMSRKVLATDAVSDYTSPYPADRGMEQGQDKATFMLFNDVDPEVAGDMFDYVGDQQSPLYTYIIETTLTGKMSIAQFGYPPYNPFIVVDKRDGDTRRREVHLTNSRPTLKALNDGAAFFGHYDDKSNPTLGRWYVSDAIYPFALDLWIFTYPAETVNIGEYYTKYNTWAESYGAKEPYWFYEHAKW